MNDELYYRARYYNSSVGRFVSEDPIGFEAGINFYNYVTDNPVRFVDPLGLQRRKKKQPPGHTTDEDMTQETPNCMGEALGATDWKGPQPVETDNNPDWPLTWMPATTSRVWS